MDINRREQATVNLLVESKLFLQHSYLAFSLIALPINIVRVQHENLPNPSCSSGLLIPQSSQAQLLRSAPSDALY